MSARNTYRRPMTGWYMKNPYFMRYMLREGTAVLIAAYGIVLLFGLSALASGSERYQAWLAALQSPLSVFFHILFFIGAVYNAYTWFKVSPKAMPPVRLGKKKIPDRLIIGGQCAGAVLVSFIVLLLAW